MTPPKRDRTSSAPTSTPTTTYTDQFEKGFHVLKRKESLLLSIDKKSNNTFFQEKLNRIDTLIQSSNRSLSEERELGSVFLAIENKLNETIKNAGNIQDIISLLEIKQALSPSLHIPTVIVILNGIAAKAPQDMKDKVMKEVKSSIDSGITEREMNSIAKAMGNDYYTIYQAHKHDVNVLAPKTGDFLEQLRKQGETQRLQERDEFFKSEYLDQNDIPLLDGIKGKLEATDTMSLDKIMRSAESVKLRGEINGKESWDAFFKDLRNEVSQADLAKFDKEVAEFKVEFKNVYNSSIDTSKAGNSIDGYLQKIQSGDLDEEFTKGVKFKLEIGSLVEALGFGVGTDAFDIGPFKSKEEAVRTLYKIKLIFKELENNGKNWLQKYYGMVGSGGAAGLRATGSQAGDLLGDIKNGELLDMPFNVLHGAGILLLTGILTTIGLALPIGITLYLFGAPLESGTRRIKDELAKRFGDKGWSRPLGKASAGIKKGTDFFGKQAIEGGKGLAKGGIISKIGNLTRLVGGSTLWLGSKPFDIILGTSGSLLAGAENIHLDPSNLVTDKVVLVDGLEAGNTGDSGLDGNPTDSNRNKVIEIRSRVKILALLERMAEYEGDENKLKRLTQFRNGSLFANSESFYIDLNNIIKGRYDDTSNKGTVTRHAKSAAELFLILNKKENVINEYRSYMKNANQMLSTIYKKVEFDESIGKAGKITIPEKAEYTDFFKNMMADLDLGLISDGDETKRQKLLTELIDEIKKGKVGFLTQDELKVEIQKIVEGKMPKFKIIQEIVAKRKGLTGNTVALENLEALRKMVLENKWYGTPEQLDTILNDITHTRATPNEPRLRSLDEIQKEGDRLHKLSLKGNEQEFNRLTNLGTFKADIKITEMLIEAGEMRGNINDIKRELSDFLKTASNSSLKLDWSVPEFHFIVGKILAGEKYSNRGDGTFGDAINLTNILDNYKSLETNIRDVNKSRLLTKIKTGGIRIRIDTLVKIAEDTDLLEEFRSDSTYRGILNTTEAEIKTKNTQTGLKLDAEKNRVDALMSGTDIDPKKGDGKTIDSDYRAITSEIQNLNREYEALDNHKTPLKNKVAFYNDALAKVTSIKAKIDKLEGNINRVKSAEARSAADAKNQADAERTAAEAAERTAAGKEAAAEVRKANYDLVERAELQFDIDLGTLRRQASRGLDKASIMDTIVDELESNGIIDKGDTINIKDDKATIIGDRVRDKWVKDGTLNIDEMEEIRDLLRGGDGIDNFEPTKSYLSYLRNAVKKGM